MTYDNIKSHKKTGFHALLRRCNFGKATEGIQLTKNQVILGLNLDTNKLNMQHTLEQLNIVNLNLSSLTYSSLITSYIILIQILIGNFPGGNLVC